jgi:L,D-transpeptidase catalytic domain
MALSLMGNVKRIVVIVVVVLAGTGGLAAALGARRPAVDGAAVCAAPDVRVVVDLKKHALALCDHDQVRGTFAVRLGRGGIGKTREGDGKTPVGVYPLGEPRTSNRYGTFIPIGFPTDEQKKAGYTGSAVGVHGPARWVKWLGSLVNTFDSSDGCVGVARDAEIEAIADWVRTASARTIELRPGLAGEP